MCSLRSLGLTCDLLPPRPRSRNSDTECVNLPVRAHRTAWPKACRGWRLPKKKLYSVPLVLRAAAKICAETFCLVSAIDLGEGFSQNSLIASQLWHQARREHCPCSAMSLLITIRLASLPGEDEQQTDTVGRWPGLDRISVPHLERSAIGQRSPFILFTGYPLLVQQTTPELTCT